MNILKEKLSHFKFPKISAPRTENQTNASFERVLRRDNVKNDDFGPNFPEEKLGSQIDPKEHLELEEVAGYPYSNYYLSTPNLEIIIEASVEPLEIETSEADFTDQRKFK